MPWRRQKLVHRDDEPERGVHRVVFRQLRPASGNRLGSMPSLTVSDQASRMASASASRPVPSIRPRMAMKVSRPQSVNQGKPAMIVRPLPRSTR